MQHKIDAESVKPLFYCHQRLFEFNPKLGLVHAHDEDNLCKRYKLYLQGCTYAGVSGEIFLQNIR